MDVLLAYCKIKGLLIITRVSSKRTILDIHLWKLVRFVFLYQLVDVVCDLGVLVDVGLGVQKAYANIRNIKIKVI